MENIYIQVLIQWLFFFALIGIILLPGFLFRKIALKNDKKGWLYFVIGMCVGSLALSIGRLVLFAVLSLNIPENYKIYFSAIIFIVGYSLVSIAVIFYRRSLENSN